MIKTQPSSFKPKNRGHYWLSLFLGTLTICIPAFINKFPFLYSDTGTYLGLGFSDDISYIRPITYGLFMRHVSLKESMWLIIFVQAFIVAHSIHLFVRAFFSQFSYFLTILAIALLTATTSIGVSTGMLMPDFMAPVLLLNTSVLLFSKGVYRADLWLAAVGLWFAVAVHHSHAYVLFFLLLGAAGIKAFFRKSMEIRSYKRLLLVVGLLVAGYFTIPGLHYWRSGEFVSNKSANIFIMNRLNQTGLLKRYLDQSCGEKDYLICQYKDSLPTSFLWAEDSPVYKDGTWEMNNERYGVIVKDVFSRPLFIKKFLLKTLETGTVQFFNFNTVKLEPLSRGEWPQSQFEKYTPEVVGELEEALQNKKRWSSQSINLLQKIVVYSSWLVLIYLFIFQDQYAIPGIYRDLAVLLCLGALVNAFFCGGISMIAPRFQSRLIWVFPLFTFFLANYLFMEKREQQTAAEI